MSTPPVPRRDGGGSSRSRAGRRSGTRLRAVVGAGLSACVAFAGILTGPAAMAVTDTNPEFRLTKADLEHILKQINIAEAHAGAITTGDTEYRLLCEDPNDRSWTCVPSAKLPYGLRTVDGSFNNLEESSTEGYGAAGREFPRIAPANFRDADVMFFDPDGPNGPLQAGSPTSYDQTGADNIVVDADPRIISNLIVDQTVANPAAVAMMDVVEGSYTFDDDNDPATPDRVFIPNVSPDVGLSAPFTGWFTLFGQFFDHGLDLVSKGGNGVVMIPLAPDDQLYNPATPRTNFIPLTRATLAGPGPDGQMGTSDDVREHTNRTTPFIDQNQTYTSHPSHQVFLREYEMVHGRPVPTGHLLDGAKGGAPTWAEVKYQSATKLGIELTDMNALAVPLLVTDPYGRFVPGATGFPQLVVAETDVREGSLDTPVDATLAMDAGVSFLDDIAHGAEPKLTADGEPDLELYDRAKLEAHYITGDGRGNENIGLTAVHHVFHAEHNRVADQVVDVLEANPDLLAAYQSEDGVWDLGERVFQAARFVTEMEYQHLVFEEFVRSIQPQIDAGPLNESQYDSSIDPAVTAEFAHAVYRFGHSMLTDTVDRADVGGNQVESLSLFDAFLNPAEFTDNGRLTPDQGAASVLMGMSKQTGNGIDEFVDGTLRNQLLGVALDLPAINIARARDTGMPTLNELRAVFYDQTLDSGLKPYENWTEFELALKNRASIVNFIAAYAPTIAAAGGTVAERRAAAQELMADSAFMSSNAGLNDIDLWVGGLAERNMDFGGMLGSTFNAVFEGHMEDLQSGDRFYYLFRTAGMDLINKLEGNSFSELAMRTTDATGLHHNIFANPTRTFEVSNPATWSDGDATTPDLAVINGWHRFDGEEHVVIHGTSAADQLHGGIGDDSIWGHAGSDKLEGHQGNDILVGHGGNDVLTDVFGDDVIHGGDGDDAINAGSGLDLLFGGFGKDFVLHGQDPTQSFAGEDTDFIRGGDGMDVITGNAGDDWMEGGNNFDLVQGDNALTFQNDPNGGADVLIGEGGLDDHDAEGGDDIMDNNGIDRHHGMLGFDWVTHKHDPLKANADLGVSIFSPPDVTLSRSRFAQVEGVSGWDKNDVLRGPRAPGDPALAGRAGNELTQAGLERIGGLRTLLGGGEVPKYGGQFMSKNDAKPHTIILGGGGSDVLESGGGDDYIDGDAALDFHLEWSNPEGGVERQATMQPFQARVFSGAINPAHINIVRQIVPVQGAGAQDTAIFEDIQEMYSVTNNGDGTYRVAHTEEDAGGLGSGVDILRNIELIQFADTPVLDLATGAVDPGSPTGTITFSDMTPLEHESLSVSSALVDGVSGDAVPEEDITYTWQWADDEGEFTAAVSGVSEDTRTFTPGDAEAGYALRVLATFTDSGDTLRSVASGLTFPVENINDAPTHPELDPQSPVIGEPVEFDQAQLQDADALYNDDGDLIVALNYQWQESNGTSWRNIVGAPKTNIFTPAAAQQDRRLRLVLTFNDFLGTPERIEVMTNPVSSVATVPVQPTLGSVTAGHASATVSWGALTGTDTGGLPLLGYAVKVLPETGNVQVGPLRAVGPETTSLKVTGLNNDSIYRFEVQAVNVVGGGAFSDTSAPVTPVSLTPGAPAAPTAVAGNASADLSWTAPAIGGSAITGYEVQVINAGGILTLRDLPVGTSHEVTALTNGTPYTFTVRALNADGPGTWSAASNEVVPGEVVEQPTEPSLSGTVTAGGQPLAGASVNIYTADTRTWLKSATSAADGSYTLTGVPTGSYRLYVQPNEAGYANQWHAGTSFESAATITVGGATTADVVLTGTFALSGVVSTDGGALGGVSVNVYTADTRTWVRSGTSAGDGSYSVAGLPAGSYRLYVQPNEPGYANRWLGGLSFQTATVVAVSGATAMDVELTGAGSLSGTVTAGGSPLSGASVAVYTADTRVWVRSGTSAADGSYTVAGVPAGSYRLYVQPNEPGYPNRWLGGVSFETATVVAVSGATPMDVVLSSTGSLSGTVTADDQPLSGASVAVYTADTRVWVRSGTSAGDGSYSVAGLPAGSYRLYVQPNEPGFGNRWLGGLSYGTATVVVVDGATPMDVVLSGTHSVSGTVTAGVQPLGGASVNIYTADTRTWLKSATSAADGSYSLAGVPAGSYRLYVQPNEPGYANRWLGGSGFDSATVIEVNGATEADIGLG